MIHAGHVILSSVIASQIVPKKKKKNLLKVTKPSDKEYLIHLAILSTWKNLTSAVQNQNSMPKG